MAASLTIMKQSLVKNLKSFNFWFMILFPLLILGILALIFYFSADDSKTPAAIVSEDPLIAEMIGRIEGIELDTSITSQEEAHTALENKEIQAYFHFTGEEAADLEVEFIHTLGLADSLTNVQVIQAVLTNYQTQARAAAAGVDPELVAEMLEPVELQETAYYVSDEGLVQQGDNLAVTSVIAYALTLIIFLVILFYPNIIVTDLAQEKGTRVMEVILSSTTSNQHFFGKILSILAMILIHLVIYTGILALLWPMVKGMNQVQPLLEMVDGEELLAALNIYIFIFILLGILIYVVMAAFLGSISSSNEDAQKAIMPLTLLGMLGYFAGMYGLTNPQQPIIVLSSYIPLFSPFIMPIRILNDTVSTTGIWIILFINLLFFALVLFITLVFYRSNLLVYSDGNFIQGVRRAFNIVKSERKNTV